MYYSALANVIPPNVSGFNLHQKLRNTLNFWMNNFGSIAVFGDASTTVEIANKLNQSIQKINPGPNNERPLKKAKTIILALKKLEEENSSNILFNWMIEIAPYLKKDSRLIIESSYSPKKIEFLIRNMLPSLIGENLTENIETAYVTIAPDPYRGSQRFFSSHSPELNQLAHRLFAENELASNGECERR